MLIPAPRNGREVFEAFRRYQPDEGIGALLDLIDLERTQRRQIFYAVLGRLPEITTLGPPANATGRTQYSNALHSEEFQKRLMSGVLAAYPEKQRLLFVHVPKCAGSDLTSLLTKIYPSFGVRLMERDWFPSEKLFAEIKQLVDTLPYSERIFVHGHIRLRRYLGENLVRFGDRVLTTVRRPLDMVVSQINYILMRFADDPELISLDTRDWLRFLDHDQLRAALASGDFRDVANHILHEKELLASDRICQYLGDGTADSAFDTCARADVEIAHVDTYKEWLATRWRISSDTRDNASRPLINLEMLGKTALERAHDITAEDRIFVGRIEQKLREKAKCFVMGTHLRG